MVKRVLVFTQQATIRLHLSQIVIKTPEKEENIPVEDVGVLVLESHEVLITNAVLNALAENNCAVITSNLKHHPSGLMLPISGNSLHTEVLRLQIKTSTPLKKFLWHQIVKAKIINQAMALKAVKGNAEPLILFSKKIISGDKTNIEARAALYYWQNFFPKEFSFKRNVVGDGINSLLNYGYSIIRAAVARSIVSSGMHPAIGLFHKNQYNPFCLADDLMEPFRPFVDLKIHKYISENNIIELTPLVKKYLISILFDDAFFLNERKPIQLAITKVAQNLVKCYNKESKKIIFPIINEV